MGEQIPKEKWISGICRQCDAEVELDTHADKADGYELLLKPVSAKSAGDRIALLCCRACAGAFMRDLHDGTKSIRHDFAPRSKRIERSRCNPCTEA